MSESQDHVQFESLETKALAVHASALFEDPLPQISVEIQSGDSHVAGSFHTDPRTLELIAEKLMEVAKEARVKSEDYWRSLQGEYNK